MDEIKIAVYSNEPFFIRFMLVEEIEDHYYVGDVFTWDYSDVNMSVEVQWSKKRSKGAAMEIRTGLTEGEKHIILLCMIKEIQGGDIKRH